MANPIDRLPAVLAEAGFSRSTLHNRIKDGLWTKAVSLGARAKGWPQSDAPTINAARIAGKSNDEIRVLVLKLEAARKAAV